MNDIDVNKIVVELVKQFSLPVLDGAKSLGVDAVNKLKVAFDKCFTKYLERYYEKYSKTKTLLYRDRPVPLKSFYVRTDFSVAENVIIDESKIFEYLVDVKRLVFSGTAGCGKSTFCKSIFIDLIEEKVGYFPIFVELRHLNDKRDLSLISYIQEVLTEIDPSFNNDQLEYSLRCGKVALILDGFDEIDKSKKERCEKEIIKLSDTYANVLFILSSRPDSRFDSWADFSIAKILPLNKEKAKSLVSKLDYDRLVKRKFLECLDQSLYDKHKSFSSNPLLLTMMLLTYEQYADIPEKVHLFYEQAFLTLFNKHDSLKSLYKRKSNCSLTLDRFKRSLSAFAVLTYADHKYYLDHDPCISYLEKSKKLSSVEFSSDDFLQDLLDTVCILQKDGLGYSFTHRSFQEYFTALFVVNYTSDKTFDLIEKIVHSNDRDDVVPMIFDINQDFLEKYWIIPKLEKIIDQYKSYSDSYEDKCKIFQANFSGVTITGDGHPAFGVSINGYFFFYLLIMRLYKSNGRGNKSSLKDDDIMREKLVAMFSNGENIEPSYFQSVTDPDKKNVIENHIFDIAIDPLNSMRERYQKLLEKHETKHEDLYSLLLN